MKKSDDSWDEIEFFVKKGARIANPRITITDNYTFLFSSAFSFKAELEGKPHVRFSYVSRKNAIVFDFTADSKAEGAYRLVKRGNTYAVTCRPFFYAYELDPKKHAGRYIPIKGRIPKLGECWYIKLDEKITK